MDRSIFKSDRRMHKEGRENWAKIDLSEEKSKTSEQQDMGESLSKTEKKEKEKEEEEEEEEEKG